VDLYSLLVYIEHNGDESPKDCYYWIPVLRNVKVIGSASRRFIGRSGNTWNQ